jgi:sulfur carrier protein
MQIVVNGQPQDFDQAPTVADLLAAMELKGRRVAVEVNREIVPRSLHGERRLSEADRVEVVVAIGGG